MRFCDSMHSFFKNGFSLCFRTGLRCYMWCKSLNRKKANKKAKGIRKQGLEQNNRRPVPDFVVCHNNTIALRQYAHYNNSYLKFCRYVMLWTEDCLELCTSASTTKTTPTLLFIISVCNAKCKMFCMIFLCSNHKFKRLAFCCNYELKLLQQIIKIL